MVFCYAAVYQIKAECATPLRTGGTDGTVERVLRRRDGRAFIQGASLAGAMRAWLEKQSEPTLVHALFGSQEQAGRLTVSDALFDSEAEQSTRPRLRIDPVSATGAFRGKFDVTHMDAGSSLGFTLVWQGGPEQGKEKRKQELDTVKTLLGAIHTGAIRLGAQKSSGFGRLSLKVRRRWFDLRDAKDRRVWLADDWAWPEEDWAWVKKDRPWPDAAGPWESLTLPTPEDSGQVVFTVTGRTGSILIKGAPDFLRGRDRNRECTSNLTENGKAILPGSSIKGAVRARVEYIAGTLGIGPAVTNKYFGRMSENKDNGLPGLVRFDDSVLSGQKQKITRIRIDRFTGGVQRGAMLHEEPLSAGLTLTITAPEEPALCALLVYALRDLGLGLYSLGSGWAIGRGRIEIKEILISAAGRQAALRFDSRGGITLEDEQDMVKKWLNALEGGAPCVRN